MTTMPPVFRCEPGQHVSLHRPDDHRIMRTGTIVRATADRFSVKLMHTPRWIARELQIDVEAFHVDGRDCFTTEVLETDLSNQVVEAWFAQPSATTSVEARRARRVDVDFEIWWSSIDDDGRHGPRQVGTAVCLSATGMRFRPSTPVSVGDALVVSLRSGATPVNAIARVVGLTGDQARLDFGDMNVQSRRAMVELVARLRGEEPDRVLGASNLLCARYANVRSTYGVGSTGPDPVLVS